MKGRATSLGILIGGACVISLTLAACASTSPVTSFPRTSSVVTYAELPATPPNYISPLESSAYYSDPNAGGLANIFWPSIYVIGAHGSLGVDSAESVAYPPTYTDHNRIVTIRLKHWRWSDGAPITARDLLFWLNLLSAVTDPNAPTIGSSTSPGPGWGDFAPGEFPESVVSYTQTGAYSIQLQLNQSYNPTWFTDDELTQIFPIPQSSWDRLSLSGPVGNYDNTAQARVLLPTSATQTCRDCYVPRDPGTADSGALGVAQFLNVQSQDLATYNSNPLWQVVSGPFVLRDFTSSGYVKMVPNGSYSGAPKPEIKAFVELPYSSDLAEFNALHNGNVDIGYIPPEDLAQRSQLEKTGYAFAPWNVLSANLAMFNYTDPSAGPIFEQLYFRQAFQLLINQKEYIAKFTGGVGSVETGPVPVYPPNNVWVSPLEKRGIYNYDPARAVALLRQHGWAVRPGGVSTCVRPGSQATDCGVGVRQGQPLSFQLLYNDDEVAMANEVEAMQSTMAKYAGIKLTLKGGTFNYVVGIAFGNCTMTSPCTDWQLADWGDAGYDFTYPAAVPAGNAIWPVVNQGDWVSARNAANIAATLTAPDQAAEVAAIFRYENYIATEVPNWMLPNGPYQLTMYKSNIAGVAPQSVFTALFPQLYRVR